MYVNYSRSDYIYFFKQSAFYADKNFSNFKKLSLQTILFQEKIFYNYLLIQLSLNVSYYVNL